MIELVRDLRTINVLAKFENDPWKIMDVRVLTGLVCPAARPPVRPPARPPARGTTIPRSLKGCGVTKQNKKNNDLWCHVIPFNHCVNTSRIYHLMLTHWSYCSFALSPQYTGPVSFFLLWLNALRPSDAYIRRGTGSSLVQIMACRLFGAKPLSEPMLEYC